MNHVLDAEGTRDGLITAITQCLLRYQPPGLMIFAASDNGFTAQMIDPILRDLSVPVFGGVFPSIIYHHELMQRGTLVIALPCCPRIQVVKGLSDAGRNFDDELDQSLVSGVGETVFVLGDGLAMGVSGFLTSLFYVYGLEVNYLGGGAGTLQPESSPCLMTNDGLICGAVVLAVLDLCSGVGVCHGMKTVSGPHLVNDIRGNKIGAIDWEPARERFHAVMHTVDPSLNKENGFPISNEYSLAVSRVGGESVVIDPFKADLDGALHVVAELSEGEFVNVVRATAAGTIRAASKALARARASYHGSREYESLLCFDCFSRWHFLGERFVEEIEALQDERCELLGVLTTGGEIANCGMEFLDYYNRTCVVGVLEGRDVIA